MRFGELVMPPIPWPVAKSDGMTSTTLYHTALQWLKEDLQYRRNLERQGYKTRGAKRSEVGSECFSVIKKIHRIVQTITDSEAFFKK